MTEPMEFQKDNVSLASRVQDYANEHPAADAHDLMVSLHSSSQRDLWADADNCLRRRGMQAVREMQQMSIADLMDILRDSGEAPVLAPGQDRSIADHHISELNTTGDVDQALAQAVICDTEAIHHIYLTARRANPEVRIKLNGLHEFMAFEVSRRAVELPGPSRAAVVEWLEILNPRDLF